MMNHAKQCSVQTYALFHQYPQQKWLNMCYKLLLWELELECYNDDANESHGHHN